MIVLLCLCVGLQLPFLCSLGGAGKVWCRVEPGGSTAVNICGPGDCQQWHRG